MSAPLRPPPGRVLRLALVACVALAACGTDDPGGALDGGAADATPIEDAGHAGADASPGADARPDDAAGADTGPADVGAQPDNPDNERRDTDCDGLSDAEEFGTVWPSGATTDPNDPDSDGDGLSDGLEVGRTESVDPACAGVFQGDREPGSRTDPTQADTDGDGLSDGAEDANRDGAFDRTRETNPRIVDTDGDGLCDGPIDVPGVCTGGDPDPAIGGVDTDGDGVPDAVDPDPASVDTDGDGLCDGPVDVAGTCVAGEDLDGDGVVGPGETDPRTVDTDCDGLVDGVGFGSFRGERDVGTDPTNPDSDGDGIPDGAELGLTMPADASCAGFVADADPTTTTDPTRADSDGDGLSDGAEDTDQNGRVDPGELDPNDASDAAGDPTVGRACGAGSGVQLDRPTSFLADLQVLTARRGGDAFAERAELLRPADANREVGFMAYNATIAVGYAVLTSSAPAMTVVDDEAAVRAALGGIGRITNPITAAFTTWDGYPAVRARFELAGAADVKSRLVALAGAAWPGTTGTWTSSAAAATTGRMRVSLEVVRRSAARLVTLVAITPDENADERARFALDDLTSGAALGQFGDPIARRCDRFETVGFAPLDILWAIDNSASMPGYQGALAASAQGLADRLNGATLDWRTAVVTSGFWQPVTARRCTNRRCGETNLEQCRPFTSDLARFARWMTRGEASWIGAGGACNVARENIVRGAQMLLSDPPIANAISFVPTQTAADDVHLRRDANLLVIFMGDADDQWYTNAQLPMGIDAYEAFFRALPVRSISLGGILCPPGQTCGETQRTPRVAEALVNRFGGTIGNLADATSIPPAVAAIIDAAVGVASPYVLGGDAIPATIKVVMEAGTTVGACDTDDVPRSRSHGWDYDPRTRTLAFFGDCRPAPDQPGRRISVSYGYWLDRTPNPDGAPCAVCSSCRGLSTCDTDRCACVCDRNLSCGAGERWDPQACDCVCDLPALDCGDTRFADPSVCACRCLADCGGCPPNTRCQASLCECQPIDL